MARWLTSLGLLLILAGGVAAGTPIFSGVDQNAMPATECCKEKRMEVQSASAAQLCCAVYCSSPAPSSPSRAVNFSPSAYSISDSILVQIALLFKNDSSAARRVSFFLRQTAAKPVLQPKYIQHHSFLI